MSTQENFSEQTGYTRSRHPEERAQRAPKDATSVIRAPLTADDVARPAPHSGAKVESARAIINAPLTANDVARGVRRALLAEGFAPICEFKLSNSRRMDVAAIGADGAVLGVEIKVAVADLKADDKWPEYLPWCDFFYFAVPPEFPLAVLPVDWGLIVADKFGGDIVRPSTRTPLTPARRRALTLRFAQSAAERLARVLDPER